MLQLWEKRSSSRFSGTQEAHPKNFGALWSIVKRVRSAFFDTALLQYGPHNSAP